ncbi:hypothetical protein, partial [Parasedimentitalea psychrophila]
MTDDNIPQQGRRFSLTYMKTDEVLRDSNRMWFRMARLFSDVALGQYNVDVKFGRIVEREIGISVIGSGGYSGGFVNFERVLKDASIEDLLDLIALMFRFAKANHRGQFLSTARRIFSETQVGPVTVLFRPFESIFCPKGDTPWH